MHYISNLENKLLNSKLTITAEIGPPKGSDKNVIINKLIMLKNFADAFNITDNQTAVVRMSSIAASKILLDNNVEPIMQITCRDRNRIAIQSDILGASALGIKNILCLTGDHQSFGNHPESKGVFDIDSIQLIQIIKNMCEKGIFQNGEIIKFGKPKLFIGAATNPFSDMVDFSIERLEKKIDAGVKFIQTQSVFNIDKFNEWFDIIKSRGIESRVHILAGITPLKSKKMAYRMKYHVPGVDLPDNIYDRIEKSDNDAQEGFNISLELIKKIKKISGIKGIHITALFWEKIIPDIIIKSNLSKNERKS